MSILHKLSNFVIILERVAVNNHSYKRRENWLILVCFLKKIIELKWSLKRVVINGYSFSKHKNVGFLYIILKMVLFFNFIFYFKKNSTCRLHIVNYTQKISIYFDVMSSIHKSPNFVVVLETMVVNGYPSNKVWYIMYPNISTMQECHGW